ncbi:MAG: xanthine dehydrogenase family protein molybdopterin-binding subunit [Pseudomonadota bacterium]
MKRRDFIKTSATLGAGLVIGFYQPSRRALAQLGGAVPESFPPNAFVRIAADNTVTVISKHTEMGQGIYTGLATMLAEELDADWSQIRVEAAPANIELYRHFLLGIQGTGGSMSVPNSWIQYRTVGATARAMLVAAAAKEWGVPAETISVAKGVVSHASGKTATFGELSNKAAMLEVPQDVVLKTTEQFTLIGTQVAKVDVRAKVDGTAQYTIDVRRPNMLVAVVAHSPRFGGKLVSFDDTATRKIKGVVEVVEIPRGVAVLATTTFAAIRGRDLLKTEWDFSAAENRGIETIIADFTALAAQPGLPVQQEGDSAAVLADKATKTIEATYVFPYLAHACMEPLDCTIELTGDRAVLRSGTQMQSIEQQRVAETLGLPLENVTVETLFAGGGFGRRGNFVPDLEWETATIIKATGGRYPIRLQYTREDDMSAGFYRPLFVHRMRAGLNDKGEIVAWENRLVGQSFLEGTIFGSLIQNGVDPIAIEGASELPYHVPNVSVDYHMAKAGIPTLSWRSVGHTHTAFSKETMMDELLHAAGKDPVAGRLALMKDERSMAVIRAAAERYGWGKEPAAGRGIGFAFAEAFGGRVAQIAEISLNDAGQIKVERVVCAVDCGIAINPQIIEAQVESAIMYGLSAALYGHILIEDGEVKTRNFDSYPVIRMSQAPQIDVVIIPSTESPTGIGEPATPTIAPAVANAYFQLTGKRVRRLPFIEA